MADKKATSAKDLSAMTPEEVAAYLDNQKSGVIGSHTFRITDLQLVANAKDPSNPFGVLVIDANDKASQKYNAKGRFRLSMGQLTRLCERSGVPSPMALKMLIAMPGGASYVADIEQRIAGEFFVNTTTGEVGVYGEKSEGRDTFATRNEEIKLGGFAAAKLADLTLGHAFSSSNQHQIFGGGTATPFAAAPVIKQKVKQDDENENEPEVE